MLNLMGRPRRFCDGTRRDFLKIGGLALGGLSLPQLLRAEAGAGVTGSQKSIIMIYLNGGPPHQDMVDLKPEAPPETRGEFDPIRTNVPGIDICEHMPRMAAMMDKFAIVRSLVGSVGRHASKQCLTARGDGDPQGGWPALGAVISKVQGAAHPAVPPSIDLSMRMAHMPYNIPGPGFLGMAHAPFRPAGDDQADAQGMANLQLNPEIGLTRLNDRRNLLGQLDRIRRNVESDGAMHGLDAFTEQAFSLLTSSRLAEALDLDREDPAVRARYGQDNRELLTPRLGELGYQGLVSKFLLARRVVEAGARCVTVTFADFDWHGNNFASGRKALPLLDQGLTALVTDLHERGMDKDVTVVVWGEFGRTPKINERAGRDHWPNVACAILAGGGMRTGQAIGSTSRSAEEAVDRPVHFQEVFATLYRNLGIDTATTTLTDLNGRPQYLVDGYAPLPELA